jgi:hypothetical protein
MVLLGEDALPHQHGCPCCVDPREVPTSIEDRVNPSGPFAAVLVLEMTHLSQFVIAVHWDTLSNVTIDHPTPQRRRDATRRFHLLV